ncbi:MAG: hypothetical protein HOC27_06195 [Phycisphaerae bacterium]|nr:hypothetical protein [Phycisphaerae bacterium]
MTEVKKHFLGWDTPFLPTAAKWLQEHYLHDEFGSAKDLVIVVSGNAVRRRLQSLLVEMSSEQGKAIDLPSFVTTSSFLNLFLDQSKKIASKTIQAVTTATVMRDFSRQQLAPILGLNNPDYDDLNTWFEYAKEVNGVARELAFGGYNPDPATWPELPDDLLTTKALDRFEAIAAICRKVSEVLAKDQYVVQDSQWLSLAEEVPHPPKSIVLLGTTDLNQLLIKVVSGMMQCGSHVDAVIRAPEAKQYYFDEFGSVIPDKWKTETIEIPDNAIEIAGAPSSQANKLLCAIASLEGKFSKDEITIAVTNEESIPVVRRQLEGHSVDTRFAGGDSLLQSPEVKLVEVIRDYSSTNSYAAYASLVRHPYVGSLLSITSGTLHELDRYYAHHLPTSIGKSWFTPSDISWRVQNKPLIELHKKVREWFSSILDSKEQLISTWSSVIRELLLKLYGNQELDRQSRMLFSLRAIFSALDSIDSLSERSVQSAGMVKSGTVFDLILDELKGVAIPEYPNQDAVDIVGWLEAMTDDAPCLFVVGMDSTLLEASTKYQTYLPNKLREELGLETEDIKYARDAHAVLAMQHSREVHGHLGWILARKTIEGDPLTPNPLLLRCEDDKQLASRSLKMIVEIESESPSIPPQFGSQSSSKEDDHLALPDPSVIKTKPLQRMSVTSFKEYIACSYRFWLHRVLELGEERDDVRELDYALFGSLVHGALELFGKEDSVKDSTDEKVIHAFLLEAVDKVVAGIFGKYPLSTISVQGELAKQRMRSFSKLQAEHRKAGWKIVGVEEKEELQFGTEEQPFVVVGKIDRIDMHEDGRVLVLDYKTGSTSAEKAHGTKDEWTDLQLPIYRHLAKKMGYDFDEVKTGFILVGSKDTSVRFDFPDWDEAQLQVADDRFVEIVEDVKAGKYNSTPTTPAPRFSEDLSWICQDGGIIGTGEENTSV